ncbi:putative LuxR-family transcriptional regulator [Actinoplanes missouriensis 431]|uniref:Putative LuxR-family transcriptional regulator n=1 Tax=Actinoplanes missouriensis (strain ATCC 14538 / DSM 43046 / CBS 188.64 / JCM 3121 / NBRC 102363 / NCIMB 12654 / NRRL B-3342 / UNCC 431) TaxID=512565 RepID=I0H5V0_ACTM4|nr:AAA family ATPase [Actinoplanes missouriensis]BAL88387.1 putative LuxR-family transcriptional regulator [Actinoplanes missouriensis 431]
MTLIGRERELADIAAVVDAAERGPSAMLVHGDAGIGKTALLNAATARARRRGHRALTLGVTGKRPFALVQALLDPRCGGPADLPRPLREPLAVLWAPAPPGDLADAPAVVSAVLLALEELSRDCPILILVDDADRVDGESLRLLGHVVAHGSGERVALLLAVRDDRLAGVTAPGVRRYRIRPLAEQAAARLLDALPVTVPARRRLDVLRRARGNPLALRVFAGAGEPIPAEFADRVRGLPAATRWLLLHAALTEDAEQIGMLTAVAEGAGDLRDWAPAERAGLITVRDGRVHFPNPFVRAAWAAGRGPNDVVRAHRALAAATGRVLHLAESSTGPDEAVAATLIEAADAAVARTDYFAAADALQAAAERSVRDTDAARRYARAVYAAYRSGHPGWAIELYERVTRTAADPDSAGAAASGAAFSLLQLAEPWQAFEVASRALLRRPDDDRLVLSAVFAAASAALQSGAAAHRGQLLGLLALIEERDGDGGPAEAPQPMMPPLDDAVVRAAVRLVADPAGYTGRCPVPVGTGPSELVRMICTGTVAFLLDDSARAATDLRAVWDAGARFGGAGTTFITFQFMIMAMIDAGIWSGVDDLLDQAEDLAVVRHVPLLVTVVPALRMMLRALRHDGPAPVAGDLPMLPGSSMVDNVIQRAAGLAALADGDHDRAYLHFRRMFDEDGEPRHYLLGPRSLPQLALTAARTGRTAEAQRALHRCRRAAGPAPTSRLTMLFAHAAALLDDSEDAETHFQRAVEDPERMLRWPLEYAEAQLNYGIWLRTRRRWRVARPHLLAARDTFLRLGAHAHADQAARTLPAGLRPAGEAAPEPAAFTALTAQKQMIARMAAGGMSNREIAGRLYLSPRTVGSHLYRIYAEIGVGNRYQLRALIGGAGTSTGHESASH